MQSHPRAATRSRHGLRLYTQVMPIPSCGLSRMCPWLAFRSEVRVGAGAVAGPGGVENLISRYRRKMSSMLFQSGPSG